MVNSQLIAEGLHLLSRINRDQTAVATPSTVLQRLHHSPKLVAYLISQRAGATDDDHGNLVVLARRMESAFNDSELRDLCLELNVDFENLAGATKQDKVREFVLYMQRHGRLPDLINILREKRPHLDWGDSPQKSGEYEIVAKLNIAVVVDIARPTVRDVARYLDDRGLDVNVVLLQNAQTGQFLSADEAWDDFVNGFAQIMNEVKNAFSGAQLHFFLSAPGALLFGLGAIWGTVDEAIVYHYEKGTYQPVLTVSRAWRG